jgi:hypothetical protein
MSNTPDSILDFDAEIDPGKSRLFKILTGVLVLYILFLIADLWTELRNERNTPRGAFIPLLLFIAIPISGLVILLFKKKLGWIISVFYYQFMVVITGTYLVEQIIRRSIHLNTISDFRTYGLFFLASLSIVFLVIKDIRSYLKIQQKMLVWTLTVATIITLALIILLKNI